MLTKDVKLQVKALDEDGTFEGYAAVFGNVDLGGDVIDSGAFDQTLGDSKTRPILWLHESPAGVGEFSKDRKGLHVKGKLVLSTQTGHDAYEFLKAGAVKGLSIGYLPVRQVWDNALKANRLLELKFFEASLTPVPMNQLAAVESVKAATSYSDLPLADAGRSWDGPGAVSRVWNWAGGDDDLSPAKFARAFFWRDPEGDPKTRAAYKLPFADVIDGTLTAVPRGVYAAAAAVQGARGGTTIPEADMGAIRAHIGRYYDKLGATPPWGKSADYEQGQAPSLTAADAASEPDWVHSLQQLKALLAANQIQLRRVLHG